MQLTSDQQNGKLTAVLLLLITLILAYMLGFHWFVKRHMAYAEELDGLRNQLGRFQAVAGQHDTLVAQLADIRASRDDAELFLAEGGFNEAAAAMSQRLGQLVSAEAEGGCHVVSQQPIRPRVQERFQRVTVNVRMRCDGDDLIRVLYRLESEVPMVLIDDLNIIRPRTRRRVGGQVTEVAQPMDVRFNMSGYLKS
ncbi:hypothetical protein F3N42_10360 [Marinihelvus fidelis]|uniref:General secretion pathway protein GspM n=1 Tax=Marinihelvus fidelis TaxID=2613842 RepID=A0A5N0T7R0_9GAMM|nr:type II secretion system protein GspM [Marinihelvus fidelis]KAA9130768.1 hypothetical protein F3N42_10360 [Marinihelvus fidelis]